MQTSMTAHVANYRSASQAARVLTETWVAQNLYCLACGADPLQACPPGQPAADFNCAACAEVYEVKGKQGPFGPSIVNGAFETLMQRVASNSAPNLALIQYDRNQRCVQALDLIPHAFFTTSTIRRRRPLGPTARRAGWVGSNILLHLIPRIGRIPVITAGLVEPKEKVLAEWQRASALAGIEPSSRGWLIDVLACVEQIPADEFSLADVYAFEPHLQALHPQNRNVRPKIRQQLQVLRDKGFIEFLGASRYRKPAS